MLPVEKRISSKVQLRDWLSYEKEVYKIKNVFVSNILGAFGILEKSILFRFQRLLRRTEYYKNTNKKLRYYFCLAKLSRMRNKYELHIPVNACGRGLRIMHLGPILMNKKVSIGENCRIHMLTSFVAGGMDINAPTVGDNCVIGIGAVLLGGIKVADNVIVGANAVVNRDVLEENIAVAGVPAKKISNNGRIVWNEKENNTAK